MRSRTIALSWKDPEVRARRIAGMVRNNKNTEYRSRQSAIRKKFLAYNPKAMEDWLSATRLGRNVALGKDVAEKRSVSLAKIRETPAFKLAHRVGLLKAYTEGKFDFLESAGGYGQKEWFFSEKNGKEIFCASSWESIRVRVLEASPEVVSYQKGPFRLPYLFDGKVHYFVIDFLVEYVDGKRVFEEIKPWVWFNNPKVKTKFAAAHMFCKDFRVLGRKEELYLA